MWQGKPFAKLNDAELGEALEFFQRTHHFVVEAKAPSSVWVYFADCVRDLTMLQVMRLIPSPNDQVSASLR
jgi:hypothetical protein